MTRYADMNTKQCAPSNDANPNCENERQVARQSTAQKRKGTQVSYALWRLVISSHHQTDLDYEGFENSENQITIETERLDDVKATVTLQKNLNNEK